MQVPLHCKDKEGSIGSHRKTPWNLDTGVLTVEETPSSQTLLMMVTLCMCMVVEVLGGRNGSGTGRLPLLPSL